MSKITKVRRLLSAAGERFTLILTQQKPHLLPASQWSNLTGKDPRTCVGHMIAFGQNELGMFIEII